jgi:hypothetical protein
MSGTDETIGNGLDDGLDNGLDNGAPESAGESEVLKRFTALRTAPRRDPDKAAAGRQEYLALARSLSRAAPAAAPRKPFGFLNRWFGPFMVPRRAKGTFQNQGGRSMVFKLASAAFLALVLILGGAGATAFAAQDSLPSEPLYAVKTATEDLNLALALDEPAKFQLAMKYINRRGDEIVGLMAQGEPLDEPVMTRLQAQLAFALQQAAGLPDGEMQGALEQYRASMMQQQQKMLQAGSTGEPDPAQEAARAMIQIHQRIAEGGIQEPVIFRQQARSGNLYGQPEMPGPYGPPEAIPPGSDQTGPGPGGKPEDPGPEQPGPAEKPPGGSDQEPGNPDAGTPQAPEGSKGPGGPGGPLADPGQGGPGAGGKGGDKGGGAWPTPTPTPTPVP